MPGNYQLLHDREEILGFLLERVARDQPLSYRQLAAKEQFLQRIPYLMQDYTTLVHLMPSEMFAPGDLTRSTSLEREAKRLASGILALLVCVVALLPSVAAPVDGAEAGGGASVIGATRLRVLEDPTALDHAVKSKIYPEDPNTMYVTLRGGGVSVFDVSDPAAPALRTRWDSDEDVEGQDRRGDLLVVVARRGVLLTFDVSRPDLIVERGRLALDTGGGSFSRFVWGLLRRWTGPFDALHVKLYDAADGRRYALVTAAATAEIIAVDVTEPAEPKQVGQIDTEVQLLEGIYVHRDHAFVGGFGWSEMFRAVDVSNPADMRIARTLEDEAYRQMVSEMSPEHPELLFAALWDDEGGLGIFDVSDPPHFRLVGRLVMPELAGSNRVKLQGDRAFLPLEVEPGGFAIVDVADPSSPELLYLATNIPGIAMPYTLEVNRNYLYIFSSREPKMAVFRLDRGAAPGAPSSGNSRVEVEGVRGG